MLARVRDAVLSTRYARAVEFLRRSEGPLSTVFWGGAYLAGALLVVPGLVAVGYQLAVLVAAADGEVAPPPFRPKRRYAALGIRVVLLTAVVSAAPVVALAWAVSRSIRYAGGLTLPAVSATPVDVAVAVVAAYLPFLLLPSVLLAHGQTGRLTAVFSPGRVLKPLTEPVYLRATVGAMLTGVGVVLLILLGVVFTYGSLLLVLPMVLFWWLFMTGYALGRAYGEATGSIDPATADRIEFEDDVDTGSGTDGF